MVDIVQQKSPNLSRCVRGMDIESITSKLMDSNLGNSERESFQIDLSRTIQDELLPNDSNENIVESGFRSFQQLCDMISDIERDSGISSTISNQVDFEITPLKYQSQVRPEKDVSINNSNSISPTYDDIMRFLSTLEQQVPIYDYVTSTDKKDTQTIQKSLQQSSSHISDSVRKSRVSTISQSRLQDELETAHLQLEEKEESLKLLKDELRAERIANCEKLESQKKEHVSILQSQKTKYQGIIKRHQKFIEQLISEKANLTEKCNLLMQKIKELEMKHQKEFKVVAERHSVELERAKELCAAAEKIRRERWLQMKTKKIKELTVKGLEPELRTMMEQHQLEIQNLKSAHLQELQNMDLRAIRQTNQQLEQLRSELTINHERILQQEKEALRSRYETNFTEKEALFDERKRELNCELERNKEKFSEELLRRDMMNKEEIDKISFEFETRIKKLMNKHQSELDLLRNSLGVEQKIWLDSQQRQFNLNLKAAETRIKDECNRERDRQIEMAIDQLEKETRNIKNNVQEASDNKLKCMKNKYEMDLQILSDKERSLEAELKSVVTKLQMAENRLKETGELVERQAIDLKSAKEAVSTLMMERDNAKKIVRQELEYEKRELKDKIASLYRELTENNSGRDALMAQLYSRIKLVITQKDTSIRDLTRETDEARKKCDHLEKLLDQQRREYVLKI